MPATRLILASASPQRRAILEQIGVSFEVRPPDVQELAEGPPHELVLENAYRKAAAVASPGGGSDAPAVLGVDTVVSVGTTIYGKPRDAIHAGEMLSQLSGRRHVVVSGVCLIEQGRTRSAAASTVVEFRAVDDAVLNWYVDSGEWRDRAGGYAIQGRGAILVSRVEGDYLNVVGLPVATLLELAPGLVGG